MAAAPLEGVGLLAVVDEGDATRAVRFYPGTNVDRSPTRYTMDPAEVLAAFRDIDANGWRLGAIVHSHPATPPLPSPTDLREAFYPEALLVIVGLAGHATPRRHPAPCTRPPAARAWRLGPRPEPAPAEAGAVTAVEVPLVVDDGDDPAAAAPEPERGKEDRDDARQADDAGPRGRHPGRRPAMTEPAAEPPRAHEALLAALAAFPEELGRTLNGQPVEALMRPASDGGWGVVENLCHLRDWEEIFLDRARAIVANDRPELPAYDDELWAIERDYRGQDPRRTFERLRELRGEFVALLEGLPDEAWSRLGVHGLHGEVTLRWLVEHVRDHDEEHLAQIREALA